MSETKKCEWCGAEFEGKRKGTRFCGHKCNCAKNNAKRRPNTGRKTVAKKCEWCGTEFVPSKSNAARAKHCSRKCGRTKWGKEHPDPERMRRYNERGYDSADGSRAFLEANERSRVWFAKLKQDPEKYAQHLAKMRERSRTNRLRKKQAAARAAYLADPVNAKRIEAANLARMTPEERAKWDEKLDKELERRDRKAARDAIRRDLAIAKKASEAITDPTWADLEWSPEPGTK